MNENNMDLGIIGCGIMAENIVRGILTAGLFPATNIIVSDMNAERCNYIKDTFNVHIGSDNKEVVSQSTTVLIAVKPQNIQEVLAEIEPVTTAEKLLLSIAAGVTSASISRGLEGKGHIIRIMPNIAAKVLESASALCLGPHATEGDMERAKKIFGAIGKTVPVDEKLMDAVTGLSGSGPAYIFLILEALADAGVKAGIPRNTALKLAAQTCLGAAKLILETGESPAVLKDQVTSPAGTTICGIQTLEKGALRGTIMDAVEAAVTRSKELGK
jgi:pyrroline-5-carboxylate reductase